MPLRILDIKADEKYSTAIEKIAEEKGSVDWWHSAVNNDGRRNTSILVHLDQQQAMMDELQDKLCRDQTSRITVLPVEATVPKPEEDKDKPKARMKVTNGITREELYTEIEQGTQLDTNFLAMTFISAVVAAIGLIKGDVAVIIGAMVIAPLLGPNIALAFGAALGDRPLMATAIKTNLIGLGMTLAIAASISFIFPFSLEGSELTSRAQVGLEGIVLALAAGAAGVLSVTTGMSGALVGVMVAVALMPPAVAMGLYIGDMDFDHAYGATLLLMVNIVCISLAAQMVFLLRGIRPRTYYMRKKSEQSVKINFIFWAVLLLAITALVWLHGRL